MYTINLKGNLIDMKPNKHNLGIFNHDFLNKHLGNTNK